MAASTLLRLLKPRLLSLRAHLDSITQIFPHRDIDMEVYLNEAFYPSLDQPSLLDRINPFVGDFKLCNSADLLHAQTATKHTKEKENKKSHHMTP